MKMLTALNFVKISKINRVACSKKTNRAENLTPQLIISGSSLERSIVRELRISKQSKSERCNHPSSGKLCFSKQ